MFFERYGKTTPLPGSSSPTQPEGEHPSPSPSPVQTRFSLPSSFPVQRPEEQPLSCLFYFFHSQMSKHTSTPPDSDLVRRKRQEPDRVVHRLDTHLNRLQMHAALSPDVKKAEVFPVKIDEVSASLAAGKGRTGKLMEWRDGRGEGKENQARDTVVLMQFQSKAARESWMASKEWKDFYENVNGEEVCRRMPHVRCARSLRGLMDVGDVLTA